jgi:hypothetical protein
MNDQSIEDINDNTGVVNFIMLGRIYDMLCLIADGVGKGEDALRLINLHQSGQLMCPPPALAVDDEQGDDDESFEN